MKRPLVLHCQNSWATEPPVPISVDYQYNWRQFDISKHLQNLVNVIAPAGYEKLAGGGGGGLEQAEMENILSLGLGLG